MESLAHAPFRTVFRPPHLRLRLPKIERPPRFVLFVLVLASYGAIFSGIIYDIINEPPSIGSVQDGHGRWKPQVVMTNRVNGQYIIEGFTAGGLFVLGGIGLILLDLLHPPVILSAALSVSADAPMLSSITPRIALWKEQYKYVFFAAAASMVFVAFNASIFLLRLKVPGYMEY